ncbi:MAG: CHAT domain-containing protein [Planctomycetota bacterium]|nr:MAG: CHAT domain-containing protein [Planctomycetota bacterium]
MWLISFAIAAAFGFPQDSSAKPPFLETGSVLQGELNEASERISITLPDDGKDGKEVVSIPSTPYRLQVDQSGVYHIDLRAYAFDGYLILRGAEGQILAEDGRSFLGRHPRLILALDAGTVYQLSVCSLDKKLGDFRLILSPGAPEKLEGKARLLAEAEDLKQRLDWIEGKYGPYSKQLSDAINSGAVKLYREGNFEATLPLFQRLLTIDEENFGPDHPSVATTLNNLGVVYVTLGRLSEALPLQERAIEIQSRAYGSNHPKVAQSKSNFAVLLTKSGKHELAEKYFREALDVQEEALGNGHSSTLLLLNNLAESHVRQGEFAVAEALHRKALAGRVKALGRNHQDVGQSLSNLAMTLQFQGRYSESEPLHQQALSVNEKALGPEHPSVALSLNNLAAVRFRTGRLAEAEPLYKRSLQIWTNSFGEIHERVAVACNNLGNVYHQQGLFQKAEDLYNRSLSIREQFYGKDHELVGDALNNLALLYEDQGRFKEAEALYLQAQSLWTRTLGENHPRAALAMSNLAFMYKSNGDLDKAEELFSDALTTWERALGAGHPRVGLGLSNLAYLHQAADRFQNAKALFEKSLAVYEEALGRDHPDFLQIQKALGKLHEQEGNSLMALSLYRQGIEGAFRFLDRELPVLSEADRFRLLLGAADPQELLAVLARLGSDEARADFDLCLAGKGKLTRLQAAGLALAQATSEAQVREKLGRLQGLQKQLSELVLLPQKEKGDKNVSLIAELRTERIELERALNRELGLRQKLSVPGCDDLQQILPDNAVLLDFYVGRRVYAWVLHSKGEPNLVDLGDAEDLRNNQVHYLRDSLLRGGRTLKEKAQSADSLQASLWQPLMDLVGDARTVFVSPDGFLCKYPLGTLPDPKDESRFLIEKHRFVYLSDATQLVQGDPADPNRGGAALAVGAVDYFGADDSSGAGSTESSPIQEGSSGLRGGDHVWTLLPGSAKELDGLAALHSETLDWQEPLQLLQGKAATEQKVREAVEGRRYVHLATHGYFEPEHLPSLQFGDGEAPRSVFSSEQEKAVGMLPGLLSGLVFAGVNKPFDPKQDDGYMSADEIQHLPLADCDLAVLSACETALGSERAGEGLMSIRRSFEVAGAKTVISSLWKVEDQATADLMLDFYRNYWVNGMEKNEALHQAKLRMLEDNRKNFSGDARPGTWGAFVLSGDWR